MKIFYAKAAIKDIEDIYEYIAIQLFSPKTAEKQIVRIISRINGLDVMPERYPVYPFSNWKGKQLRWFPVDHYLVFYFVDEQREKVMIIRIMYQGRDIQSKLESGEWLDDIYGTGYLSEDETEYRDGVGKKA